MPVMVASFAPRIFLLTPPRGAALHAEEFSGRYDISTHAPHGGDLNRYDSGSCIPISTHAPARGATGRRDKSPAQSPHFYSRPREGATNHSRLVLKTSRYFYSRPREGGDMWATPFATWAINFYSRPREGGDQCHSAEREILYGISTHAPARGATAIFHKNNLVFCSKSPKIQYFKFSFPSLHTTI